MTLSYIDHFGGHFQSLLWFICSSKINCHLLIYKCNYSSQSDCVETWFSKKRHNISTKWKYTPMGLNFAGSDWTWRCNSMQTQLMVNTYYILIYFMAWSMMPKILKQFSNSFAVLTQYHNLQQDYSGGIYIP